MPPRRAFCFAQEPLRVMAMIVALFFGNCNGGKPVPRRAGRGIGLRVAYGVGVFVHGLGRLFKVGGLLLFGLLTEEGQ